MREYHCLHCLIETQKKRIEKGLFIEIKAENFLELITNLNLQIQEAQCISKINKNEPMSRCTAMKLKKKKKDKKVFKAAKRKYMPSMKIDVDFSVATMSIKRQRKMVFKLLRENTYEAKTVCS